MTKALLHGDGGKIKKIIERILPGIFLLGFCIGTGSVTAMAKAGADYGMSLLWTIFLSCIITFLLIHLYGKYAVVTGENALEAFKKHIHPAVGIFFIIALGMHVAGSVIGVMGIIADVCYEWSKSYVDGGVDPLYFALFFVALVYLLFLYGEASYFLKALSLIVAIMALAFLINFFILMPPVEEIFHGLIPSIPETKAGQSVFLVIASMVGTTVFSGLFIVRTTLVKEAGWTLNELKTQRTDALFSAIMMFVISASVMAAAAGTLYLEGIRLENVSQMINLLEPLAGLFAVSLFAIGLVAAGVSSQLPNVLLVPWLICDYSETERNMKLRKYRIIVLIYSLLGLIVPVFKAKPVLIMIASQAFGALHLPVVVACIIYLGNRKSLMQKYAFSATLNIILGLIFLFALTMAYMGYSGLFATLSSL